MSRISRSILTLLIIVSLRGPGVSAPADEATEMLARAVALYYEADFARSIELLLRADELLRPRTGQLQEKAEVKMQLALAYIGLNDNARAKTYLEELFALDPDRQTDPQMFSPKVIQLAEEARASQNEQRCRAVLDEANRHLVAGNSDAVVSLIGTSQAKCAGLTAIYPKAAELFFKEGLDAYRGARTETALQKFRAALRFAPRHELASQYVDLALSKLEVAADRALLAWRKDFNAGDFVSAARDYRELSALGRPETLGEIHTEYRRALSNLVDSWNKACASDDAAAMEAIRIQADALLPEPSIGVDILERMTSCTPSGCIQMNTQLALARLKTRVDPQFSPYELAQLRGSGLTVRVKAKINEKGDAVAGEMLGGNPLLYRAVRAAFDQWTFSPAIVQGRARCVDTEIPIVINLNPN
jgi:tetratricopeptide (TPR) repeat protein